MALRWLSFVLLAACSGGRIAGEPGVMTRGPQVAQLTATSVLIAWRGAAPEIGQVDFGLAPAYGDSEAEAAPTTEHVVVLGGLAPDTRYDYRLRQDGVVVSEGHAFTTASADPDAPFRFVAIGDNGMGTTAQGEVAAGILAADPALVIHTGDAIYDSGREDELDPSFFTPYAGLLDRIPFYITLGNHDVFPTGGDPLIDAVYLPGAERFYSFDRGPVHFACIEVSLGGVAGGAATLNWLAADLAATNARWIVFFCHYPFYSSSRHGTTPDLAETLGPILEQHGVDLVLNGHDHNYERTFPMAAGAVVDAAQDPDYVDPGGPVYIVTGGAGRFLYDSGASFFTAYSESVFHFVQVDVTVDRLDVQAIDRAGAVIDRMSITKSP